MGNSENNFSVPENSYICKKVYRSEKNDNAGYNWPKQNKETVWQRTEITPVLPITGQKFLWYTDEYLNS